MENRKPLVPVWPKQTCERFVGFLDIMGFKEIVNRSQHEIVLDKMLRLKDSLDLVKRMGEMRMGFRMTMPGAPMKSVFFSDSVLLVSADDNFFSGVQVLLSAIIIVGEAARDGIAMTGAIACGKQTAIEDKSVYFGQPLIDAYGLQKEIMMYGVVLHNTAESRLSKEEISSEKEEKFTGMDILRKQGLVVDYTTPLKGGGKAKHSVVTWEYVNPVELDVKSSRLDVKSLGSDMESAIRNLYLTTSGRDRQFIDNTLEFLSSSKMYLSQQK